MTNFKSLMVTFLGDPEKISSEKIFVINACFFTSIILFFLCAFHLILNLGVIPVFIAGGSAIFIAVLYLLVRFGDSLFIPKVVLTFGGLIACDFTWYSKYLSNGPLLILILTFAALIIWVWEGKWLAIWISSYFLNLGVLFLIEYNTPELLLRYPDQKVRSVDIYLSLFFYSSLLIILLFLVKKEFIRQRDKAVKSDKIKSAFLANMSHEIRTPMNAIVGFSHLLGNGDGSENKDQYISIIQNSSDHLLRLISDIIDLSKIDAGDMEIRKSNLSIKELFIELNDIFSIELLKRKNPDVKVNYLLPDGEILLQTDPFRLRQILTNLLNNAIKFTAQGTITMSCEKKGRELLFSVSDTGTGIPDEDQKTIFDHFTKFNYLGMNNEGTGIGLSIVDKLVKLLNGRLWLKSVFGGGSCFYFSIPYVAPPASFSNSYKKTKTENQLHTQETSKSILVVEDDDTSFMLLKEFLRPLNLEIHRVTDGTDAINFIKMNPDTSLILMDIKLPFMDGYEATKAIRKINLKIPIIAQTAYAMIGDKEKALSAGCNDYLTKPLDSKSLQQLVEIYLHG